MRRKSFKYAEPPISFWESRFPLAINISMKHLIFIAGLIVFLGTMVDESKAQLSGGDSDLTILPLKGIRVNDFKAENEPIFQIFRRLSNKVNADRIAKGLRPVEIKLPTKERFPKPHHTFHVQNMDLYTLLEYLTVGSGYEWKLENKQVVIFSTPKILERYLKAEAMAGRDRLRAVVIPSIEFRGQALSKAIARLQAAARGNGLGAVIVGSPVASLRLGYDVAPEDDFLITGKFINTDVDTVLEMITQQAEMIDWTFRDGNVELILARDFRQTSRLGVVRNGVSSAADPFADPVSRGGSVAIRNPGRPRIRRNKPGGAIKVQKPGGVVMNTESYDTLKDNPFLSPLNEPLSTFSIDVDTASYSNIRRFLLDQKQRPPADAVRIEEMINYFDYEYAPPQTVENADGQGLPVEHPFATHLEVAGCPWKPQHRLVRIGLKGYEVPIEDRPPSNLVFLLDVSGSMSSENKLPLVKKAMSLLVRGLKDEDRVAIVVYAGASGTVLESTPGSDSRKILQSLKQLKSGGSTNAGEGITLAYKIASDNFIAGGNNRVILCTDGDFNVGNTNKGSLTKTVAEHAKKGVQISIMGFGMGNYKDDMLETISNAGDGNYGYIDSMTEARKLFVQRLQSTLLMIAKDVKIQVEFNPRNVNAYRLIGYENRLLDAEDFADDKIDAGDIGAGHTITALYEVVPAGIALPEQPGKIELKYQKAELSEPGDTGHELLNLKLRYKWPEQTESRLIETPAVDKGTKFADASRDFQFASAVAGFGMLLRESPHSGDFTFEDASILVKKNMGNDPFGNRAGLRNLIDKLTW